VNDPNYREDGDYFPEETLVSAHTPGPWKLSPYSSIVGIAISGGGFVIAGVRGGREFSEANARLIAAAPELLALAHRYAKECGECAGTRVCPDDEPCTECTDIWRVIDMAEGRA
jgi:hypothetical protein